MNKITSGILGLVTAVSLVSAVAYAAFSDTVLINGMSVSVAGAADLKIQGNFNGVLVPTEPADSLTIPENEQPLKTLAPGDSDWAHIVLTNDSDFAVSLTAQLLAGVDGDWEALKNLITVEVYEVDETNDDAKVGDSISGTLNDWFLDPAEVLPGGELPAGETRDYYAVFSLSTEAGNEVAGETLSSIDFQITGTQVLED